MNVNRFIYESLHIDDKVSALGFDNKEPFICAWCGEEHKQGFKKNVISSNFTNWDLMSNPDSKYLCKYCALPFLGSIDGVTTFNGKTDSIGSLLKFYHFIATQDKFYAFKNDELPHMLFNVPVEEGEPFVFCATYAFKKHNSFRSFINYSKKAFKVRIEDAVVDFNTQKALEMVPILWELYLYFTKEEIIAQNFPTGKIFMMGVDKWQELKEKQDKLEHNFRELLVKTLDSEKRQAAVKEMDEQRKAAKKTEEEIKKFIQEELKTCKNKEIEEKSETGQLSLF